MEQYYPILKNCALFRKISEQEIASLMVCLGAQVRSFKAEDYIFFSGDEIGSVGIVLSGIVEVMKENLSGNKHIVALLDRLICSGKGLSVR